MRRTAFTLVETLLATTLAGAVVMGSLGVLGAMQRADTSLTKKFVSAGEIASLHRAMTRAFQAIVVSPTEAAASTGPATAGTRDADAATIGDQQGGTGSDDDDALVERPRIILAADGSALAGSRAVFDMATWQTRAPQALEIVLEEAPAAYAFPARFTTDDITTLNLTGGAIRGVFELRPDEDDERAWVLWWRPVREDGSPWNTDFEISREDSALRLIGGLTLFRVQIFDDRVRKSEFQATGQKELPAYIEVELRTVTGMYANWMFEIDWKTGDEQHVSTEEDLAAAEAEDDEGNGAGGGGGGNGGVPGGGRPRRSGRDGERGPQGDRPPGERAPEGQRPDRGQNPGGRQPPGGAPREEPGGRP